jgi:hypothetical protein
MMAYSDNATEHGYFGTSAIDRVTFASFGANEAKCVTYRPFEDSGHGLMLGCESGVIHELVSIGAYKPGT